MTSSGPSEDLRTPTPEQVAAEVEREGYAVLRDVVDASLVTALRRRIDELMEELAIPFGEGYMFSRLIITRDARNSNAARVRRSPSGSRCSTSSTR